MINKKFIKASFTKDLKLLDNLKLNNVLIIGGAGTIGSSYIKQILKYKPSNYFGQSKLLAEEYILSKEIPNDKHVYILRPCMIHGPGNKGNLNLLYKIVSKNIPWPLGAFENKRSFCKY